VRRINLVNHNKAVRDNVRDHKCNQCDFESSDTRSLVNHMKSKHGNIRDQKSS
jgi:hypothetical protein